MRTGWIIAAVVALAACGAAGGGPALPDTPEGGQAPADMADVPRVDTRAQLTNEQRAEWQGRVREYLAGATAQYARGMTPADGFEEQMVELQQGSDYRWHVELQAGTSYRFIGACDDDCRDLDFELIAPQGGVVASDRGNARDDFPVVNFTPTENGRYIARLLMMNCSVAPCFTGMRVLTGQAAPDGPAAAAEEDK